MFRYVSKPNIYKEILGRISEKRFETHLNILPLNICVAKVLKLGLKSEKCFETHLNFLPLNIFVAKVPKCIKSVSKPIKFEEEFYLQK